MFQESRGRFRILQIFLIVAGLALAGRVVQVQVFQHSRHLEIAQKTWTNDIEINPERGNLYDRDLRPLALSVSAWRVGVATVLLDQDLGAKKISRLLGEVLDRDASDLEKQLVAARGKHVVVAASQVLTRQQMMRLKGHKSITVEDLRARVYPYDGLAASLIGFHRKDKEGDLATGLEHSLRRHLDGSPGKARQITTGNLGQDLGQVEVQAARHGKNLVLTLDADIQEICERQLANSVKATGAVGGSVLVLDPHSGDVLAAASWPLMSTRQGKHGDPQVWNNRNFSSLYEPGSVFKIFTAASLLKHGAIDTAMVFDCSNSDFGGFTIRNDEGHAYGDLALMSAFAKSSNIFFARAVGNLRSEELYHDLLNFGFGQDNGFPYPGGSKGILKSPDQWSGRSKPTIAIGQEVAVTPLQLGMAVCAVANGGTLYSPRLISEVKDERGRTIETMPPRALRQVMSEPLAELIRQAMGRVVEQGTGVGAKEDWIRSGGKTGTAQKSRDGRGYTAGAYIASFSGMVPVDDPRLVVLTVLDEPKGIKHYASLSAVPLYRDVVRDIRARTEYLTDVPGARTAPMEMGEAEPWITVPDVLHLSMVNASQRLRSRGFRTSGTAKGGLVVQQVPLPGTRMARGSMVQLTTGVVSQSDAEKGIICPDFSGLSNRQVRSLAARLGLKVQIQGAGYAVSQSPLPGLGLATGAVAVKMEGKW